MKRRLLLISIFLLICMFIFIPEVYGMQVYINTSNEYKFILEVESSDTIEAVKNKIKKQENIDIAKQTLIFSGTQLEEERTLADYNIQKENTIDLFVKEAYEVVFDANGGSFQGNKLILIIEEWEIGDEENLEVPTRLGYKFMGYFTEKIGGTALESYIAEAGIDGNLTFYAQWEKLEPVEIFEMSKNQEFIIGIDKNLIFYLDNDRGNGKVFINAEELSIEKGEYTWNYAEGIYPTIKLSEDYMKTLKVGEYKIKFILDDGREVETTFTVSEQKIEDKEEEEDKNDNTENPTDQGNGDSVDSENIIIKDDNENNNSTNTNNPQTGDNVNLFIIILAVSSIGMIFTTILSKKYKNK